MRFVSHVLVLGFVSLAACSVVNAPDDPQPANNDAAGGGTPEGCPDGFEVCGGACVSTTNDVAHCGECGNACGDNQVCALGQCLSACSDGTVDCGGDCVDVASDTAHCGGCDNACPSDGATATCNGGTCSFTCSDGFDDCDGDPANACEQDIATNAANCGACGKACIALANAELACDNGACVLGTCKAGFDDCDGNAANGCEITIATDESNCTACGMSCTANQLCANGCVSPGGFSADQVGGVVTPDATCDAWNTYRASLTAPSYSYVGLYGTNRPNGLDCFDTDAATQICHALREGTFATVQCEGRNWNIGTCGADYDGQPAVEINVGDLTCNCQNPGDTIRACYNFGVEWGGLNSDTCNTVSQTYGLLCLE